MMIDESDDVFNDDHDDNDADDEKENVEAGKRNQQVHHHLMPVIMCKYNPTVSFKVPIQTYDILKSA